MEIRKDILGNTPEIGDIIAYNPVHYKGLIHGNCVGFSKTTGLPIIEIDRNIYPKHYGQPVHIEGSNGNYFHPKTGFVIVKK